MSKIILNELGDTLVILPDLSEMCISVANEVLRPTGEHAQCGNNLYCVPISETHNAICCARCLLRFPIPKTIDTFEKLREWCSIQIVLGERKLRRNLGDRLIDLRDATMEVKRKKETEDMVRKIAEEAEKRRSTNQGVIGDFDFRGDKDVSPEFPDGLGDEL